MSELKTIVSDANIEDFLNSIENEEQKQDCFKLLEIMKEITSQEPKMWWEAIVGFWSYTYKYSSWRTWDWMRVAFSPRKNYTSVYVMPGYDDFWWLLENLWKFKSWKSCLNIKKLSDINIKVLKEIIISWYKKMEELYPTKKD